MPAAPAPRTSGVSGARRGVNPTAAGGARPTVRTGGVGGGVALQQENASLKETVSGLERERDFYFNKLRDIELLIQEATEADPELEKEEDSLLKQIQAILYSTEVSHLSFSHLPSPSSSSSSSSSPSFHSNPPLHSSRTTQPKALTLTGPPLVQEGFEIPPEGAAGEDLETF